MQDHDNNVAVGSGVDELTHLFVPELISKRRSGGVCQRNQNDSSSTSLSIISSSSSKKLVDYRKQRAAVQPINHLEYILTPNRHNKASPLRSFDEAELPSLTFSLEDSVGSMSLADTQSCMQDSGNNGSDKVEFYLKVPKREQKCKRRESLQSIVSKMHFPNIPKSDRRQLLVDLENHQLLLDPETVSPRKSKLGYRATRRLSSDECYKRPSACYTHHVVTRPDAADTNEGTRCASFADRERQERMKRLSAFCSMRNLHQRHDHSRINLSESESNTDEMIKSITKQQGEDSRFARLQKISGFVSTRHLKGEKSCPEQRDISSRPWNRYNSYPFEIVVPHPDLSGSRLMLDGTSKRTESSRRNYALHSMKPKTNLRRAYSVGEELYAAQWNHACSPRSEGQREKRRWSSSCDGRHARRRPSSGTAAYTEWKIELMLKTK